MSDRPIPESDAHLLGLPFELRRLIYAHVVSFINIVINIQRDQNHVATAHDGWRRVENFPAALFLTCSRIYHEISAFLLTIAPELCIRAEQSQLYDIKQLVVSLPPRYLTRIWKMSINIEASWVLNASILCSALPSIKTLEIRLSTLHQHVDYCDPRLRQTVMDSEGVGTTGVLIHESRCIDRTRGEIEWLPNAYLVQALHEHLLKTPARDLEMGRDDSTHDLDIMGKQTVILKAKGCVLGYLVRRQHGFNGGNC